MNDSKISVRYAKALYQAALEEKKLDTVVEDMRLLESSLLVEGFKEVLESPVVKISQKKNLLEKVYKGKIDDLSFHFLTLLLENKRENYITDIIRNLKALYKEKRGIKTAEITVASEINEEYRNKFLEVLKRTFKAEIELEEKIKPEIIGGFILKVEDEQYDASVTSRLAKIRKKLLQTTSEK